MVSKLIKHEWIALLRKMIPLWAVVLGIAVVTRLVYLIPDTSVSSDVLTVSAAVLYGIAVFVCLLLTAVNLIVRFYRNMFTAEGYLTLTLPATPAQHLLAKGITAFCVMLCSLAVTVLSLFVITFGDLAVEIGKAIEYLYPYADKLLGDNLGLFILEAVVFLLVYMIMETYFFYMVMSLGQLAKKNRVAASVGIYFLFYIAAQILSTLLVSVESVSVAEGAWESMVAEPFAEKLAPFIHGSMLIAIGVFAALTVVWFFVSRFVLTKKLNLE